MRLIKEGLTAATSTSPHLCLVPGDLFITLNSTVTTPQPGNMRMEHSSFSAWSTQHCFNSPLDLLLTTSTCSATLTFRVWYILKYHHFHARNDLNKNIINKGVTNKQIPRRKLWRCLSVGGQKRTFSRDFPRVQVRRATWHVWGLHHLCSHLLWWWVWVVPEWGAALWQSYSDVRQPDTDCQHQVCGHTGDQG